MKFILATFTIMNLSAKKFIAKEILILFCALVLIGLFMGFTLLRNEYYDKKIEAANKELIEVENERTTFGSPNDSVVYPLESIATANAKLDSLPPLPKGYSEVKEDTNPPLPKGYSEVMKNTIREKNDSIILPKGAILLDEEPQYNFSGVDSIIKEKERKEQAINNNISLYVNKEWQFNKATLNFAVVLFIVMYISRGSYFLLKWSIKTIRTEN